ncbi:hypothetical protein LFL96_21205 [Paraburkholderia sp. D15]|uniref:hypothetical protein n=1 Tax=Paraburkholderia sp. D15 TaxID=2880218 RepID=UPI00247A54AE|nr:hypothetical protein [Paraburkholderia sp. D15]WGS53578.1 hypothetical protein LFL96_21205 [Paraburkholderia sp. D15]
MAKVQQAAKVDATPEVGNGPASTLAHYLVVRHAFDDYRKGDAIRAEADIIAVLASENARNVHKVIAE